MVWDPQQQLLHCTNPLLLVLTKDTKSWTVGKDAEHHARLDVVVHYLPSICSKTAVQPQRLGLVRSKNSPFIILNVMENYWEAWISSHSAYDFQDWLVRGGAAILQSSEQQSCPRLWKYQGLQWNSKKAWVQLYSGGLISFRIVRLAGKSADFQSFCWKI